MQTLLGLRNRFEVVEEGDYSMVAMFVELTHIDADSGPLLMLRLLKRLVSPRLLAVCFWSGETVPAAHPWLRLPERLTAIIHKVFR